MPFDDPMTNGRSSAELRAKLADPHVAPDVIERDVVHRCLRLLDAALPRGTEAIGERMVDLLGAEGMLLPAGYTTERPEHAFTWPHPQRAFLRTRENSMEGGTSEIMRSILADRVLGLPSELRPDKKDAWSQGRQLA